MFRILVKAHEINVWKMNVVKKLGKVKKSGKAISESELSIYFHSIWMNCVYVNTVCSVCNNSK